jgi:hypothetical protein
VFPERRIFNIVGPCSELRTPAIVVTAGSLLELPTCVSHRRNAALQQAPPAPQSRNAAHNNNRPLGAQQIYDWLTRAPAPPAMANERRSEQLETCWRVVEGSTARILTCAVFSVFASGLELRVGYLLEVPLHSERVTDIQAARALAQNWLTAMRGGISTRNLRNRNVDWQ